MPCFIRHGVDLGGVCKRDKLRTLPAHRLAGAHKRGALHSSRRAPHYSSRRGSHYGLGRGKALLSAPRESGIAAGVGWVRQLAGEYDGLFEQPAGSYDLQNSLPDPLAG